MTAVAAISPRSHDAPIAVADPLLVSLFENGIPKIFPKNALIAAEDERNPDAIYLIQAGRIKVFLCSAEGKEIDLDVLEPGDYFGEMELDGAPGAASAMAMERSQLIAIRRAEFKAFASGHPDFAMQLIARLVARNRKLLKSVKSLALLDVSERVARLLLDLATEENGKLVVTEKLSKRDIAKRVGATREMASRVFKNLISSGYIRLEHQHITIAKPLPQHW